MGTQTLRSNPHTKKIRKFKKLLMAEIFEELFEGEEPYGCYKNSYGNSY